MYSVCIEKNGKRQRQTAKTTKKRQRLDCHDLRSRNDGKGKGNGRRKEFDSIENIRNHKKQ